MGLMDKASKTLHDLADKGKEGIDSATAAAKSDQVKGVLKEAEKQVKDVAAKVKDTIKGG